MQINRREFIIGGAATLGAASPAFAKLRESAATNPAFLPAPPDQSFSILNRISYGATPLEEQRLMQMGLKKYLEYQLNPASSGDDLCKARLGKATLHIEYKAKEMKPGDKPEEGY